MPLPDFTAGTVLTAAALDAAFALPFPVGIDAWQAFTPTLTQSNTPTKTSNCAYMRIGRLVVARYHLVLTSAGTANNQIIIGLPVGGAVAGQCIGSFWMNDAGSSFYSGVVYAASGTTMNLVNGGAATNFMGVTGGGFTAALANTDTITATVQYETAS